MYFQILHISSFKFFVLQLATIIGEGTTEVSILGVEGGIFEVKSVAGNAILGWDDFDNRPVNYFAQEFKKRYKTNIIFIYFCQMWNTTIRYLLHIHYLTPSSHGCQVLHILHLSSFKMAKK